MTSNTTFSFSLTAPDATMNITLTIPRCHLVPEFENDIQMSIDSGDSSTITLRPTSADGSLRSPPDNDTHTNQVPAILENESPGALHGSVGRAESLNQDIEMIEGDLFFDNDLILDSDSSESSQIDTDTDSQTTEEIDELYTMEEIDEMYARLRDIEHDRRRFIDRVWNTNPDLETKDHWSRLVLFSHDAAMWAYDNQTTFLDGWQEINDQVRQIEIAQSQVMQAILYSGYDADDEEHTSSFGTSYSSSQSDDSMDVDDQGWPEDGGVPLAESDSDSVISGDI